MTIDADNERRFLQTEVPLNGFSKSREEEDYSFNPSDSIIVPLVFEVNKTEFLRNESDFIANDR